VVLGQTEATGTPTLAAHDAQRKKSLRLGAVRVFCC